MTSVNEDIRRLKIRSRNLFVAQALLVCAFGGLFVYKFWNPSEKVKYVLESGKLVLIFGAVQLLAGVCTSVPVDRTMRNTMLMYALWSLWVIIISACHWWNISESKQTWTYVVAIPRVYMMFYVILCVCYCVTIHKLPQEETNGGTPTHTRVD